MRIVIYVYLICGTAIIQLTCCCRKAFTGAFLSASHILFPCTLFEYNKLCLRGCLLQVGFFLQFGDLFMHLTIVLCALIGTLLQCTQPSYPEWRFHLTRVDGVILYWSSRLTSAVVAHLHDMISSRSIVAQ